MMTNATATPPRASSSDHQARTGLTVSPNQSTRPPALDPGFRTGP